MSIIKPGFLKRQLPPFERWNDRVATQIIYKLGNGNFARASKFWWPSDDNLSVREFASGQLPLVGPDRYALGGLVAQILNDDPRNISLAGTWAPTDVSGSYVVTANVEVAPDGTTTAAQHDYGADPNDRTIGSAAVPAQATLYQCGVWAKTNVGTKDFRIQASDGVANYIAAFTATTTWEFHEFTFTTAAVPTNGQMRILNDAAGTTGTVFFWGAILQSSAGDLHPAPSLDASYSVAASNLKIPAADVPAELVEKGFWFYMWPRFDSTEWAAHGALARIWDCTSPGSRYFALNSGAATFRVIGSGGTVNSAAKTWSANQRCACAIDWENDEAKFLGFTTGDETIDITGAGDWTDRVGDFQAGNNAALTQPFWGDVSSPRPLSSWPG
jgi:hypothetical protein